MRASLTIAVAGAALAATMSFVLAGGPKLQPNSEPKSEPKPQRVAQADLPIAAYYYQPGARIIHVPQPGDERANVNERDEPDVTVTDDEVEQPASPSKPRRVKTKPRVDNQPKLKPQRRADAPPPPPPGPPRTVLSAPPPPAGDPTPIRPTPRFRTNAEIGEKFSSPIDPVASSTPTSDPRTVPNDPALPPAQADEPQGDQDQN